MSVSNFLVIDPVMKKQFKRLRQFIKDSRSYLPWLGVGVIILIVAGSVITSIPPRSFILSTGTESGIYYRFAQQYQQQLAREGIEVQLRPGAGSIETLGRLAAGTVDVGFVQGGTVDDFKDNNLQSFGSLYYEPIWIFHQKDLNLESLADLNGLSVNIGAEGSGITPVALQLLDANAINLDNIRITQMSSAEAGEALQKGTLDVGFFIISPDAPFIETMIRNPQLDLFSFRRAKAYTGRFPFITQVTLEEGVIDIATNIPPRNITLLAVTAELVVRDGFHPALVRVLTREAQEIHRPAGLLESYDEFPSLAYTQLPVHDDAARYYREGETWLDTNLPPILAALLNRWGLWLIGLLTLYTVFRSLLPLYTLQVDYQVTRWYRLLRRIESEIPKTTLEEVEMYIRRLGFLRRNVLIRSRIPFLYMHRVYILKAHISMVLEQLRERREELTSK